MTSVLHIVPDSFANPRHRLLGSTKDIAGRVEYFESRGVEVDRIHAENRSDEALLERLSELDLARYRAVFFELPLYPRSLRRVRERAPQARRLTRAINAELYHQLHIARAHRRHPYARRRRREPLYAVARGLSRLRLDRVCARRSDLLLGISDWETRNYWRHVAGSARTRTLPYFLPSAIAGAIPRDAAKEALCVCLLSTSYGIQPFPLDAAQGFSRCVRSLASTSWRFALTGSTRVADRWKAVTETHVRVDERIERLGYLEDPFELLGRARAVALLSDLGFGFKTKILDAIESGCWVLTTRSLRRRLPEEVRPWCLEVDPDCRHSFRAALDRALQPVPGGQPNAELRKRAFQVLDDVMAGP